VNLLALTSDALQSRGVAHAVIGATALAVHGVTRATADIDVLALDPCCLDAGVWSAVVAAGATVDIRHGDADDPFAGVIRVTSADETAVDVIVGRAHWQTAILQRALVATVAGTSVAVAHAADIVLLKLYAGGPQDAWDIEQLVHAVPDVARDVAARIEDLPPECAALWERILRAQP